MSQFEKVTVDLTPALKSLLQSAVDSGHYATTSEIVREALLGWSEQQNQQQFTTDELRKLWADGIASGPSQPFSMAEIIAQAKSKRAAGRN